MSRWARWTIAIAVLLLGWEVIALSPPGEHLSAEAGLLLFLGMIVIACLSKTGRPVALRVVGGTVFFAYLAYFFYEFLDPIPETYKGINQEHWVNALFGLLLYGLPGLYVAATAGYPKWGIHAKGFRSPKDQDEDKDR